MALREQFRRRRKDTRFILGGLGILLAVLTGLYYALQRSRDLPSAMVTNRVLLFILWYVNVILILTILFVLTRDVLKVLVERRNRILGSKFKIKLLATYIGLSLFPVLFLFVFASDLIDKSIDRWFNLPVREVLQRGSEVAQAMQDMAKSTTLRDARMAAEDLSGFDLETPSRRPSLDRQMRRLLAELDVDLLAVYRQGEFVHGVVRPRAGVGELPEPSRSVLAEAAQEGEALQVKSASRSRGLTILALTPIRPEVPAEAVVVAGRILTRTLSEQSRLLIDAYQGYRQLELEKDPLKASHLLLILMVTLLILLASSWVGLHLARRVTVPIQALADGTRHISGGDLSYRVDVEADDELGVLVDSFNQMTGELERNKELLESSYEELVDAHRKLAEERALLVAVLQNVAAGVIAIDGEGKVFLANEAACAMLQQREEELLGRPIRETWADGERSKLLALLDRQEKEWSAASTEVRLVLGGEWKSFEVSVTKMEDPSAEALGEVLVVEDLTELIKAQKLAAWNEAARRIAHEIKNPLTPIQLAAERMIRKYRQGGEGLGKVLDQGVQIIVHEVETLKGMVDEFSRFARMPRPQPTAVDLRELIENTVKLYTGLKEGVEVSGEVEAGAELAWADPELLKSALINLLDNALEATAAPGSVAVTAAAADGKLLLRVADSGRGIPPAAKEKLFLPYYSTKGRGTGLGLAIVHRIVADHHGNIRVEDNEPQGTVFTVELPAS